MFCRWIVVNTFAVGLGLVAGLALISVRSESLLAVESSSKKKSPKNTGKVYDIYNVDYELPSAESTEFKNNKILKYKSQSMDITGFKVPAHKLEDQDIDKELEAYYQQDDLTQRAEEAKYHALSQNKMSAYHAYLNKKAALQAKIDKELRPILDDLTITMEDVQLASLDE